VCERVASAILPHVRSVCPGSCNYGYSSSRHPAGLVHETLAHNPTSQSCYCEEWNDEAISVLVIVILESIVGLISPPVHVQCCSMSLRGVERRSNLALANEIASGLALAVTIFQIFSRNQNRHYF